MLEESVIGVDLLLLFGVAGEELLGRVPADGLLMDHARVEGDVQAGAVCLPGAANLVRSVAKHHTLVVADRSLGPVITTATTVAH